MNRVSAQAVSNSGSAIREGNVQDSAGRRWHTLAAPGEKCETAAQDRIVFLPLFTCSLGQYLEGKLALTVLLLQRLSCTSRAMQVSGG